MSHFKNNSVGFGLIIMSGFIKSFDNLVLIFFKINVKNHLCIISVCIHHYYPIETFIGNKFII
jgi:hypothetical protein